MLNYYSGITYNGGTRLYHELESLEMQHIN